MTSRKQSTKTAAFDIRRACWTINVVSWALYRLCPDSQRHDIASWMIELGRSEIRKENV